MKTANELGAILLRNKRELADKYKVSAIGLFGSIVRGEQCKASDLDILVEFVQPIGLLKFVALERHLSQLLDVKVDLVMKSSLKPRIGKRILQEVMYI